MSVSGCHVDTTLINMHEHYKISPAHRSAPDQGEGHTVKAIVSYIIPCSLKAALQLCDSQLITRDQCGLPCTFARQNGPLMR